MLTGIVRAFLLILVILGILTFAFHKPKFKTGECIEVTKEPNMIFLVEESGWFYYKVKTLNRWNLEAKIPSTVIHNFFKKTECPK